MHQSTQRRKREPKRGRKRKETHKKTKERLKQNKEIREKKKKKNIKKIKRETKTHTKKIQNGTEITKRHLHTHQNPHAKRDTHTYTFAPIWRRLSGSERFIIINNSVSCTADAARNRH